MSIIRCLEVRFFWEYLFRKHWWLKNACLGSIADLGNILSREAVKAERATKGGEGPPAHGNGKYICKGVFVNTVFIRPRCVYSICMPFVFYYSDSLTRVSARPSWGGESSGFLWLCCPWRDQMQRHYFFTEMTCCNATIFSYNTNCRNVQHSHIFRFSIAVKLFL